MAALGVSYGRRHVYRNQLGAAGVIAEMCVFGAKRVPAAAATALLVAACGSVHAPTPPSSSADVRCVPAPIHHGPPPSWSAAAWSDSSPGFSVPYALASNDAAGAFLFANPLRAGHPSNPSNKVLWIVRFPRDGHPLTITARLSTDPSDVVQISRPADSSPGEIYPSTVDLPKPGCWRLSLAWGSHRARIDVEVRRSS
jgi:hypothetical protein